MSGMVSDYGAPLVWIITGDPGQIPGGPIYYYPPAGDGPDAPTVFFTANKHPLKTANGETFKTRSSG